MSDASPLPDPLARFRLDGRVALVAGGTGGIGLGLARALGALGAAVAIVGRDAGRAEAACAALGDGMRTRPVAADLTRRADADRAVEETVAALGRLDVLVNCVGGGAGTALYPAESYPEDEWD